MAELIASGTTAATSADFTNTSGSTITLFLKDAAGADVDQNAIADLQIKVGSEYFNVGSLVGMSPAKVLSAAGTFRISRRANAVAFGVENA